MLNIVKLKKARNFAIAKHAGQLDDAGNDYYTSHCVPTYELIIVVAPFDFNLSIAALLHDTLENTNTTYEELVTEFGKDVADLVNEVTKPDDARKDYFPNLNTQRGIMLKLADRLSNVSRMETWNIDRQKRYLERTKFWES